MKKKIVLLLLSFSFSSSSFILIRPTITKAMGLNFSSECYSKELTLPSSYGDGSEEGEFSSEVEIEIEDELEADLLSDEKFMTHVVSYISQNATQFIPPEILAEVAEERKKKKKRKRKGVSISAIVFAQTTWGKLVNDPEVNDPKSASGKVFRRRFRLPFPLFKEVLVPLCEEYNVFNTVEGSRGRSVIPIELKIMAALRILGRGSCCDDISEMSEMVIFILLYYYLLLLLLCLFMILFVYYSCKLGKLHCEHRVQNIRYGNGFEDISIGC